jgi:hypothetical protein
MNIIQEVLLVLEAAPKRYKPPKPKKPPTRAKPPTRFRTKTMKKTLYSQRNVFAGGAASRIAKQRNPALAARKARFRMLYLQAKQREQQMYGRLGMMQARKLH